MFNEFGHDGGGFFDFFPLFGSCGGFMQQFQSISLLKHYIMRGTRRLFLYIFGPLNHSFQRAVKITVAKVPPFFLSGDISGCRINHGKAKRQILMNGIVHFSNAPVVRYAIGERERIVPFRRDFPVHFFRNGSQYCADFRAFFFRRQRRIVKTPHPIDGICVLIAGSSCKNTLSIFVTDAAGNESGFSMGKGCRANAFPCHTGLFRTFRAAGCLKFIAHRSEQRSGEERAVFRSRSAAVEIVTDGILVPLPVGTSRIIAPAVPFNGNIAAGRCKILYRTSVEKPCFF